MAEIYTEGGVTVGNGNSGYAYPVMPYMPYGMGFGGGFGNGFGGDLAWIIILIAILGGNNGFGGFGGGFGGGNNFLYDVNANTNRGFDNLALNSGIDNLTTAVSNGFANAQVQDCNSTTQLLQAINGVNSNFQNCCCENRLATADLKSTIIQENCQDREVINLALRDVIASNTANTQAILDKLCQQEIDAKNDLISQLRSQLSMADLRASQTAQTAAIREGQISSVNALVSELRSCPIPAQPVYGSQPIFTCPNNNGCGCGSIQ